MFPPDSQSDLKLEVRRTRDQAGIIIAKIEQIFESIVDCILEGKAMMIHLKIRENSKLKNKPLQISTSSSSSTNEEKTRKVCFPSRNPSEAWKFTVLLRILELCHEALVTGIVITKRDIYYREPELFKQQKVVDRYLNDIAHTLGVERHALNVIAAAKGLMAGSFTVTQRGCSMIDCFLSSEGILIPNIDLVQSVITRDVNWILVIEKEATFRTLISSLYWKYSSAGKGILITAKGYPDMQTRQFLRFISLRYPKLPIYALMDFDPDGIAIMATYKFGSIKSSYQKNYTVPQIEWIGIKSNVILHFLDTSQGLQILSARDRRLAIKMLERVRVMEWKEELQIMLMLNLKAEIQILGNSNSLCQWLDFNLLNGSL